MFGEEYAVKATKENCRLAIKHLEMQQGQMGTGAFAIVHSFLQAALRRLPTEAAVERDAQRKGAKRAD
jgi:hypothetical protein